MNVMVVLLIPLAVLALCVRTFLLHPFSTPSGSMAPTLVVGDEFLVAKFAYGYSRFSFPLSPDLFSGRILGSQPAYGDIVAFRLPKDPATDYIKRVVGLPGDRVQMKVGQLHINGQPVPREPMTDLSTADDVCGGDPARSVRRWRERLPNGVSHETLDCVDGSVYDNTREYVVPAGHYFMVGDNRDNSTDSRALSLIGYIPYENLIGRFVIKYGQGSRER
jgi:signal peptidase I